MASRLIERLEGRAMFSGHLAAVGLHGRVLSIVCRAPKRGETLGMGVYVGWNGDGTNVRTGNLLVRIVQREASGTGPGEVLPGVGETFVFASSLVSEVRITGTSLADLLGFQDGLVVKPGYVPSNMTNFAAGTILQKMFIYGKAGDDTLKSKQGNDLLIGGAGNDVLEAGEGRNKLDGGAGNDTLKTGSGKDVLIGGAGNDMLDAGEGDNLLVGGAGRNTLMAGGGNDSLIGGRGDDLLVAGGGGNRIIGGAGNDTLRSGSGNDWLEGGRGSDLIETGGGKNRVWGGPGRGEDTVYATNDDVVVVGPGSSIIGGNGVKPVV